jgi:hypothetical protein
MKLLSFLIFSGVLFLASCHDRPSAISLTKSSMYSIDTVRLAGTGGDEQAAGRKLQEALALYRKKGSDTAAGIELFKSSILLQPTAKAYFELAGALLSTRQYDEGLEALSMAEALGYSPMANVMFRYAYAYANKPDDKGSLPNSGYVVRYMELAIQMGYAHPRQFLQRDLFPDAARKTDYDVVFTNALSGGSARDPAKPLWDAYEAQFPEIGLPLVIDLPWMQKHKLDAAIDFQYEKFIPDMRDAKFDREGGTTYYYLARIHQDQAFVALLYGEVDDMVEGDESQLPLCTLVTYDRQGKLIDQMAVAGRKVLSGPYLVFSIQPDLKFRVQGFKDVYKDDPDTAGYENNPVIRQDPESAEYYQIAANGKFQPTDAPLARR